jgi:F-type H+-transporting ATPase subunit a
MPLYAMVNTAHQFVADMIDTNAGHGAREFLPFVFTLFFFILFGNLMGVFPLFFTFTSHIAVTVGLSHTSHTVYPYLDRQAPATAKPQIL